MWQPSICLVFRRTMSLSHMLRFASYDAEGGADTAPLRNVVLYDKDEVVVGGRVLHKNGLIQCEREGRGATGLGLLYDVGEPGDLCLRTCLLEQRSEPYILAVELARHRIAMFVHKAEEWMMIELDEAHPAMWMWNKARQLFTKAMVTNDPVEADRAGRESLGLAVSASERLAMAHAEILLKRRFRTRAAPSTSIGVRLDPRRCGDALREVAHRHFRLTALPLRWDRLCPTQGEYHWDEADDWIAWAEDNGLRVLAGPLIDLGRHGLPGWVSSQAITYPQLRDLAYEHVKAVVTRYGDHIGMWSIGTGFNTNTAMPLHSKDMIDLVRTLALRIREGHRGRRVIVEIEQPWSEYMFSRPEAIGPVTFVEQIAGSGVRLDAVGLRLQMGDGVDGRAMRDLMEMSRLLDRYFQFDPKIIVTDLGVPDRPISIDGGRWRGEWSEELQGRWAMRVVPMLLSKPHIESVIWTDLFDHAETLPPHAGLITEKGAVKGVLKRLISLRKQLSKPLGSAAAPPTS
ncbi:MAG: hypothetical protein CMJ63_01335 [Planctomycetaceae bacterium]|nr:hypothetical protein [Planctomycetaceae bacterium]